MTIDEASEHFGSDAELARQLGFRWPSTVCNWRRAGKRLIPELYARQLHEKTRGKLKFDRELYA